MIWHACDTQLTKARQIAKRTFNLDGVLGAQDARVGSDAISLRSRSLNLICDLGIGGVVQLQLLCERLVELHCRQAPLQPEQARETLVEARARTLEREFGRQDANWGG